ncbi:MAG: gamma-glutamyl-gamma-aminobutyrate hydrolase family protein [Alphaproteobacteria bacterium]|nr:gamma-glutamyl-gamma-aminobutyrate hydrolase family protein [Alphaproteobacteria bacterium]
MKPVIGITTYGRFEQSMKSTHYDSFYVLPVDYASAVRRASGIALYLPPGDDLFPDALSRLDGVIFTGGTDIDPARYGGDTAHPELTDIDAERDEAKLIGIKAAIQRRDLPILCICRGIQLLNVALGGNLVEHVPDLGKGDIHRDEVGLWAVHGAEVIAGTKTAAALGAPISNGTSGHHQALKTVAPALTIAARAPDGVIEAVEHQDHPWYLAVQWHPEVTADVDPVQQNLFDALVREAGGENAS